MKFDEVADGVWVENTAKKRRYQIIRQSNGQFDWHLIQGILALSSGQCDSVSQAISACESDASARKQRKIGRREQHG